MTPRSHRIAAQSSLFTLCLACAAPALAASPEVEKQKSHTVTRLYQMTYGTLIGCSQAGETHAQLTQTIADWRKAQPELFALMEASPYLPNAKQNYKPSANNDQAQRNCEAAAFMIQQLMDTPSGQDAAKDILETLKK